MTLWSNSVGVAGGIPIRSTIFTNLPTSISSADFKTTITLCPSNQVIQLTNGTYAISGDVDFQSANNGITLRGNGPSNTKITMTGVFYVRSQYAQPTTSTNVSSGIVKDAYTVSLANGVPSFLKTNHLYFISQTDDTNYCMPDGLEGGHGPLYYPDQTTDRGMSQLNRLVSISGTTLTFELPMLWDYGTARSAAVRKSFYDDSGNGGPRRLVGFEEMTIEGNNSNTDTDMIRFENADSCWVTNVTITNMIGRDGIYVDISYRVQIDHCDIRESHSYAAGDGYGVGLYNGSTGCLIHNNIFETLHIGVDMSFSAAGNVIAYNYIGKGGPSSGTSPGVAGHGHHNWMNLIEGNYSKEPLTADITHGSASHFTWFRNRVNTTAADTFTTDKTPIVAQYYNRYCNIVANFLGSASLHNTYRKSSGGGDVTCGSGSKALVEIGCGMSPTDTIAQSQVLLALNVGYTNNNSTISELTEGYSYSDLVTSYYLSSKPAWFGNRPWPWMDPQNTAQAVSTNLPAGYRYTFGVDPPAAGSGAGSVAVSSINLNGIRIN